MSNDRCPFCAAKHACPKCGKTVPDNLDYDDICTGCMEWRFRRVPRLRSENPAHISPVRTNYCPAWERVPPSEVRDKADNTASTPIDLDAHMQQVAQAVGDDNAAHILAIAQRSDLSGESKMKEILRLDRRFAGKDSNQWSKLLGVSPNAIRGYSLWKELKGIQRENE